MSTAANVELIDLRSDTVTKPTPAMRIAMAEAEVGDDVFGDDPTVLKLQKLAANILGKEAALFVPSGTMGNLISCLAHCTERGSEMIVGDQSHIHYYEQGNAAQYGGIHSRTVLTQPDGTLLLDDIRSKIRPPLGDDHLPLTKLICIENTHNRMGGRVLSIEYCDSIGELCKQYGLKYHCDGARLMNAAVVLQCNPARLVQYCDSVSLCLSKGLAAPIGSIIAGTNEFIVRCKRIRKSLGGGMRQVGILAAAGIISLESMINRLSDDHQTAKLLAAGLIELTAGIELDYNTIQTNIVYFNINSTIIDCTAAIIVGELKLFNILAVATDLYRIRFVTHYMINNNMIQLILNHMKSIINSHIIKQ